MRQLQRRLAGSGWPRLGPPQPPRACAGPAPPARLSLCCTPPSPSSAGVSTGTAREAPAEWQPRRRWLARPARSGARTTRPARSRGHAAPAPAGPWHGAVRNPEICLGAALFPHALLAVCLIRCSTARWSSPLLLQLLRFAARLLCHTQCVPLSRRRDCHFADAPPAPMLKHLMDGEEVVAERQSSRWLYIVPLPRAPRRPAH